jgi:hypothetical protein
MLRGIQIFAQKDRLVLHFHGGLVPLDKGEAAAARLLSRYRDQANAYPFFVIWRSGLWEVLRHNWQEIIGQDVFPRLVERVLQFIWGKLDQKPGQKGLEVELPTRFAAFRPTRAPADAAHRHRLGARRDRDSRLRV